ncbi:hypothetical protein C6T69_31885 [Burkholderia multivorans]|nr:hypothetical protein C6T69_31885 [Burkholderia multivorans]
MSRNVATAPLELRLANWGNAARGVYDRVDAARITKAWETLHPRHRDMLRMVYLWHADREVICRRLHIPRRPAQRFALELAAAHAALARALETGNQDRDFRPPTVDGGD